MSVLSFVWIWRTQNLPHWCITKILKMFVEFSICWNIAIITNMSYIRVISFYINNIISYFLNQIMTESWIQIQEECTARQTEIIVIQAILLCNRIVCWVYVSVCVGVCTCDFKFWLEGQDILVRPAPKHNYVMDLVCMQHITLPKWS